MEKFKLNSNDIIFSLDIGTRSVIGTVGIIKDKKFNIIAEKYLEHEVRAMIDGQIHDINIVANEVKKIKKELENDLDITLNNVSIAAAGRFLRTTVMKKQIDIDYDKEIDKELIRSLELTAVKGAEDEINKQTKGKLYCVGYSIKNYYLNGYIMSNLIAHHGDNIGVEVIATFLPRSVVDSLYAVMDKVSLNVINLTLEPIAAMEAVVPKSFRLLNIALVDIGAGTSDIAISSNETISAYGMVPLAGDEVTEIIAKTYLVDFNTAEKMKKESTLSDKVKFTDVLGMENEVDSDEIFKVINPVVDKITTEVANKIIELNGGKAPNAVFLVGGGAYTPNIDKVLCEKLKLPLQRVAIKNRQDVQECSCGNDHLNSIGVTVLGIALVAIKKSGHDFIDVTLNDKVISLFNSHKHIVQDVMLQAGINPKILVGKNGKSMRFTLNGIKRVSFGSLAQNAKIRINGQIGNLDSEVKEGDNLEIDFAQNGNDACPKVYEYVKNINSISFYIDDIIHNIEPVVFINDIRSEMNTKIQENDDIKIIFPSSLGDYKEYFEEDKYDYCINGKIIEDEYVIKEGDRIYRKIKTNVDFEDDLGEENLEQSEAALTVDDINLENTEKENIKSAVSIENSVSIESEGKTDTSIEVIVNNDKVKMTGKEKFVFVDIFNYIEFDLSNPKGNLILRLNDKKVGYYDELLDGDMITIKWE